MNSKKSTESFLPSGWGILDCTSTAKVNRIALSLVYELEETEIHFWTVAWTVAWTEALAMAWGSS